MTKRNLIIAIPIVAIVLNGLGYLIVTRSRGPATTVTTDSTGGRPSPQGAQGTITGIDGTKRPEGSPAPADDPAAREAQAQARRAAGLTALEAGEYDKALINFTEAKSLIGDKANVGDLLKVTEELRRKPPTTASVAKARPPATPPEPTRRDRPPARSPSRRVAVREEAMEESGPPPPPAVQASGLLIVTTTPRGMLVHVDETPVDLTPMKTKVKAGSHRVALMDGDRKVYETTVDIREGGTATILRDLSAERAAEAPRPIATTPPPAPLREEAPRPTPTTPTATTPSAIAMAPAKQSQTTSSGGVGDMGVLEISSPGLYGVVWVNGRPRGYPPLAVRDLPPGPAKVEVRVNGVQKRTATAMVKAGLTTSVKLRSLEGAP